MLVVLRLLFLDFRYLVLANLYNVSSTFLSKNHLDLKTKWYSIPKNAGSYTADLLQEFELKLLELHAICAKLNHVQSNLITNTKSTFNQAVSKINGVTKWRFERINNQLNAIEQRSIQETKHLLLFHKQYISSSPIAIQTLVKKSHQIEHHRRTMLQQQLTFTMNRMVDKNAAIIESLEKQIHLMSPSAVLARGFAIARSNGKAILSKTELHPGSMILIELSDGTAEAEVKST